MPIANRYSIEEIIDACRYYVDKTGRRITFEYSLVGGKNDSEEDALNEPCFNFSVSRKSGCLGDLNCSVRPTDFVSPSLAVARNEVKILHSIEKLSLNCMVFPILVFFMVHSYSGFLIYAEFCCVPESSSHSGIYPFSSFFLK